MVCSASLPRGETTFSVCLPCHTRFFLWVHHAPVHVRRLSACSFWEWAGNVLLAQIWTRTVFNERRRSLRFCVLKNCMEQAQVHASGFRYGHNLVGVKTPRSIFIGDFLLLHDNREGGDTLSTNVFKIIKLANWAHIQLLPAVLSASFVLALLGAGKASLLIANAVVDVRGTNKLDVILDWRLSCIDCWVGPRLFGAMLRFEQLGALGSDIARIAEIGPHARIVIASIVM